MSQRHRVATLVLLSSTALASPGRKPPPSDSQVKKELLELRAEALHHTLIEVDKDLAHYRPLCDKDGYPLVGNVAVKGEHASVPSMVCFLVRDHKAKKAF